MSGRETEAFDVNVGMQAGAPQVCSTEVCFSGVCA
jgi:hypothetical protein